MNDDIRLLRQSTQFVTLLQLKTCSTRQSRSAIVTGDLFEPEGRCVKGTLVILDAA